MYRFVAWLLGMLIVSPALAQEADGAKVYKQVVPSVAWIHSKRPKGTATGSGSLIDRERRLVLTNYHVVGDEKRATLYFPVMRNGQPVAEKEYYIDRKDKLAHIGWVIARDKTADLALIQLERVPRDAPVLPLAPQSAEPGQNVHSIGSAGRSTALWGYVAGKVRAVHKQSWKAELDPGRIVSFNARVVETNSATNPGDSGGPLVNDKGELVAVTQGAAVDAKLLSYFIDVSQVRSLLRTPEVQDLSPSKRSTETVSTTAKRTKSLPINDKAALFSKDGVKKAQEEVDALYKKYKVDFLVETYESVPEADVEKVGKMSGKERNDYMRDWSQQRVKAENVQGFLILISNNPKAMWVEVTSDQGRAFRQDDVKPIVESVIAGLRSKMKDDAILEPLKKVREHLEKKK